MFTGTAAAAGATAASGAAAGTAAAGAAAAAAGSAAAAGTAAATGAAAAGAAAAGTGFFASLSTMEVLMLASTALSTGASVLSGMRQSEYQEMMADFNMSVEEMEAATREAQRQEQLNKVLASQRAMFGAAGLDLSSGTPVKVREETIRQAQEETNFDRGMTQISSMASALKKKSASSSMTASVLGAAGGVGEAALDLSIMRKG